MNPADAFATAMETDARTLEGLAEMLEAVSQAVDSLAWAVTRAHDRHINNPHADELGDVLASLNVASLEAGRLSDIIWIGLDTDAREAGE